MLSRRTNPRLTRLLAALAITSAAVLHVVLQAGMMWRWPGWNLSAFRNYFASDQLAYLAIASDVANGESAFVEPYTLTGTNYYPRGHYIVLGTLARWTSTHPATMWTLTGLAAQVLLVAAIGVTCVLLSRRWWTGFLGVVPFLLGTGSWIARDSWMTLLDSHAVLWGPFGVFFTLNGESVALCISAIAMLALVLVAAGRLPARAVWPVALVACLVIGGLANIQTYAFLTSVFVLAGCSAAYGLVRARSWVGAGISAVLLVVVFVAGPLVADAVSPLAALVLGLAPALPGLVLLTRATGWRILWCAVAAGLGAAPQVLATVLGLVGKDDFLVYREASSKNLGVPLENGLFAAAWILPALAFVLWLGIRERRVAWTAFPLGLVSVWSLLATNDRWGANQEPYRFWLDTYALIAVLVVPLVVWSAATVLARPPASPVDRPDDAADDAPDGDPHDADDAPGPDDEPRAGDRSDGDDRHGADHHPAPRTRRPAVLAALAVVVLVAGVGARDWPLFRAEVTRWAYIGLSTPRYDAAVELASRTDGGIVLTDACIDPLVFKVQWGGPVVFYNPGLAWPEHVDDIKTLVVSRGSGELDVAAAERADVRWVLADPTCDVPLRDDAARLVDSIDWTDDGVTVAGTLELWSISG